MMKIYSHDRRSNRDVETDEITILAEPEELLRIARFINNAAGLMRQHGAAFGHEHLQDFERADEGRKPDIVIASPSQK
jgi:hypothetical protein